MTKQLRCNAIFPGCEGVVNADSEEEVIRLAVEHAKQVHGVTEIDAATAEKVKAAIQNA